MTQSLLFPDPRPLVEVLGSEFFRHAPERPGVYLMRDKAGCVLYVGKAKNLRKRLCSYRVANPDRMARRHLRLLRAVAAIELQECVNEQAALARESELLRNLRPQFNRAGTWPGTPRFLSWRIDLEAVELAVTGSVQPGWHCAGPLGAGADVVHSALLRLLWCAINAGHPLAAMPHSWFRGRHIGVSAIPLLRTMKAGLEEQLVLLCCGDAEPFAAWIRNQTSGRTHPFEVAVRDADLETVIQFGGRGARCKNLR